MASNILKNNGFGGPTYFDRWWATCLGAVDERAELGWPSSSEGGPPYVKVAHVYVVLRYGFALVSELTQKYARKCVKTEKIVDNPNALNVKR